MFEPIIKNEPIYLTEKEYLSQIFGSVFNAVVLFSTISFIIYLYRYFKYINIKELSKEQLNMVCIYDFFNTIKYILIFLSYTIYTNSFLFIYFFGIVIIFSIIINGQNFLELLKRTDISIIW